MTPDERNMLTDLANKIAQTPAPPKDPDAEDLIRTRIGSRPDALYLMTQTVLIQNLALQHAQEQIQQLQRGSQSSSPVSSGSFLGGASAQPRNPGYSQPSGQGGFAPPPSPAPQYAPAPQFAPAAQSSGSFSSNPGGAPSFLKGAAQTAAGVAAGALAFEGIQSLFSHPGYGGGSGFGGFGSGGEGVLGGGGRPEETVVNNYYDQGGRGNDGGLGFVDPSNSDLSNLNDSSLDDTGNQFDDSTVDDAGLDDSSSFDDSGDTFA